MLERVLSTSAQIETSSAFDIDIVKQLANKKLINKAKKILELIVEDKVYVSRREDGCYDLEKGCTLLARIIRDNFGINFNKKSLTVQTPEFLKNAVYDFRNNILLVIWINILTSKHLLPLKF